MISDTAMRSGKGAAAYVFATATLVGIAGYLSIVANVPLVSSPFAYFTILPAFLIFALAERSWPETVLIALSTLPIMVGFLIFSLHLFRQKPTIPKRSVVLLFAFTFLSVAWFCFGWTYGIQYQGRSHVLSVAALNAIFISAALVLLLINRKTPRFGINLAFHGTMFVWLAYCALPWMGELP